MSYFLNNKIYDVYYVDSTIYANDGDIIKNEYIEVFNNEELIFDFTKMNMICSNEQVKGSELHKIKIDWGDGTEDILVKDLSDRGSSLNTVFQSWKRISHLYNSDKKKVYLTEDVKSLSSINIYFYNTYNDVIRLVIPFKLVYKSLYDLNCRFDLVSANTGNDYLTTFVFKEGLGNSLSVVQNINPMLQINYEDNIEYIKNKTVSIDYSDDFIDEDNVKWAWDQIPYVSIKTSCDKYYPNYTSDKSNALTSLRCECFEETVPIENWKPIVERILDDGNVFLSNVSVDKNGAFMFYVFGGNEVSKIEEIKEGNYEDLKDGMYQIQLEVTGINEVTGKTDKKIVAIPESSNYAQTISYDNYSQNNLNNLIYDLNLTKDSKTQWSFLKNAKLILKPTLIDESETGLDINENNWVDADESFKFEFPLDLNKETKDGKIQVFKKSLPNGTYDAWCESEDLLGNKTDTTNIVKKQVTWKYNDIGEISYKIYNPKDVLNTTIRKIIGKEPGTNEIIYERIGKVIGDCNVTGNYSVVKEIVDDDTQVISWFVTNPSEMDKIQFRLEYCKDPNEIGSSWEIVTNDKKSHNLWDTEAIIENKSFNDQTYDFVIDDNSTVSNKYQYSFNFPLYNHPDGYYKATMSHILDMNDYVGERKVETTISDIILQYEVPVITINEVKPIFKFNKISKSWQPYVIFDMSCSKTEVTDVTINFDYPDDTNVSESIFFKNNLEKSLEECLMNHSQFDVYCLGRDSKDYLYKRVEENPTKVTFIQKTTDFLKCHTSIPNFNDTINPLETYEDSDGEMFEGIDILTQSAIDVYRTHRCTINDVDYFKYVEKTTINNIEQEIDANYFNGHRSYFMTKKFTPVYFENDQKILDENDVIKRMVQADKTENEFFTKAKWTKLQSAAKKLENKIPLSYKYDNTLDKATVTLLNDKLDEVEDILYANVKMYKDGTLTIDQSVRHLKEGEIIKDVDLGNYFVELEYSSIDTNTVDSNTITGNFKIYAEKNSVLSDVNLTSNDAGEGLYTVTFNWNRHHNYATNLTLYIESNGRSISFDNALNYDTYTPSYLFEKGETLKYSFIMTSDLIDFGTGLNNGEVYGGNFIV